MKGIKRAGALFLALVMSFAMVSCGASDADMTITQQSAQSAAKWVKKKVVGTNPGYGDEWALIALTRGEYLDIFSRTATTYQQKLDRFLAQNSGELGVKGKTDAAGYPRVILALTSVGKIANHSSGGDMVMGISLQRLLDESGIYGTINGLIAADCGGYEFHEGGDVDREGLLSAILSWQHEDGGFGWEGAQGDSDVDTTAMALQALSNYRDREEVAQAVERALTYLVDQQLDNGGYAPYGAESCESASQVVIALTELGMDPASFGKGDILAFIMGFQNDDGSFSMEKGKEANETTTVQALLALVAYNRAAEGKTSLYDMSDVYGSSHNKLSPTAQLGTKISMVFSGILILSMIILFIRSRFIIHKWRKEGVLDESGTRRLGAEELEAQRMADQLAALREEGEEDEEDQDPQDEDSSEEK